MGDASSRGDYLPKRTLTAAGLTRLTLSTSTFRCFSGPTFRVSAVAAQSHELAGVLALGRAKLASWLSHAVASLFRAFLGSVGHHEAPPEAICALNGCRLPCTGMCVKEATERKRMSCHRLAASRCSACLRLVSVSFSPLSMRAISRARSASSIFRMAVWVRPRFSVFSIRKCWSAKAAI